MQKQNGIHLEINEIFNNIKLSEVITLDKTVNTNFTKYSTSVQMTPNDFSNDFGEHFREHIEKDIASTISRKCIKEIVDNSKIEYLDLTHYTNDIELDRKATDELIHYITNSNYTKCILGSMLAACIQDDARFHFKAMTQNSIINGADIYGIGSISNVEIYVDPYMKYTDFTMILLNDLRLNLELIENKIVSEPTFHSRLLIDFNMFSSYDALVCRVLDKKRSENYLKYISDLRNQKIDDILND
jgi:hypothetical protein